MIFHSCSHSTESRDNTAAKSIGKQFPFLKFNSTEKSKLNLEDHQTVTNKFGFQWFQSCNLTVDLRALM